MNTKRRIRSTGKRQRLTIAPAAMHLKLSFNSETNGTSTSTMATRTPVEFMLGESPGVSWVARIVIAGLAVGADSCVPYWKARPLLRIRYGSIGKSSSIVFQSPLWRAGKACSYPHSRAGGKDTSLHVARPSLVSCAVGMRNEAQTRFELIDPTLVDQCGWRREDIRLEQTLPQIDIIQGKGFRRPSGRTDYVLCRSLCDDGEPIPLAIVEAKKESLPAEHGLQQARRYKTGKLHHVPFVFSSNGHQFVEFDEETGITSEARPLNEFPGPDELAGRFLVVRGLNRSSSNFSVLTTKYEKGREFLRYYQDAAIRAAFEQLIKQIDAHEAPRVMLPLATGAGKTRLAAALLRKLFDAGRLGKALFLCDRTELRDNGLSDFQAVFGTDAAEVDTRNPQKTRAC
jgi:hypothetical protein